jgi:hypothetical protein
MATKSLRDICEDLADEIREQYELGHGDAEELFKQIWAAMTGGPSAKKVQDAINLIDDVFAI